MQRRVGQTRRKLGENPPLGRRRKESSLSGFDEPRIPPLKQVGVSTISAIKPETQPFMKKTLFLSPPSFDGFDGGAGARYQAKREITSFWYPTWLAQPAALVPGSRLVDAPPHHQTIEDVLAIAKDYELVIMHTSTPSLPNDAKFAAAIKAQIPLHSSWTDWRSCRRFARTDAANYR